MNGYHEWLILAWVMYYAIHSIGAASRVKSFFQNKMKKFFRYYRLAYSFFATVSLLLLLWYQYSFESPLLFHSTLLKYISVLLLVLPGMMIMLISIKKYFFMLSGVRSLYEPSAPVELKVEGIHRFVRHPLYSGTILFVWGLFFIFPTLANLIAATLLLFYILLGITFEEAKLKKEFGKEYEDYISRVPMLIPDFKRRK